MMLGHLRARGLTVQQTRVRESMERIDPCGTVLRSFKLQRGGRTMLPVPTHCGISMETINWLGKNKLLF